MTSAWLVWVIYITYYILYYICTQVVNIQVIKSECSLCRLRFQRTATETVVNLDVDLSEDEIERMLDHINQLRKIR